MSTSSTCYFSDEVFPNLFLGSVEAFIEELPALASKHNVQAVLRCIPPMHPNDQDCCNREIQDLNAIFENSGIISAKQKEQHESLNNQNKKHALLLPAPNQLKVLAVEDDEEVDIFPHLHSAVQWIEDRLFNEKVSVLVHCRAGVSRSATVVAAFLVKHLKIDAETALDKMRESRPRVCPNSGFLNALVDWTKEHLARGTRVLLQPEIISGYSYRFPKLKFAEMRVLHANAMNLFENEKRELSAEEFEKKYPSPQSISKSISFDEKTTERLLRDKFFERVVNEFVKSTKI